MSALENGNMKIIKFENADDNLTENLLEKYFEDVKYENNVKHNGEYLIIIKDKNLINLEYNKIHIISNNNILLVSMSFKFNETYLFKVKLPFEINMTNYNIELKEDSMKIILVMKDYFYRNKDRKKHIENFRINLMKMYFFKKMRKIVINRLLYSNAEIVYGKKLKKLSLTSLKLNYFKNFKKKVNIYKFKKIKTKVCWNLFIKNYAEHLQEKSLHCDLKYIKRRVYVKNLFFKKCFYKIYLNKCKKEKLKCLTDNFYENKINLYKRRLFYHLKIFYQKNVLVKYHNNIANKISNYLNKKKLFKYLIINYVKNKKVLSIIMNYYIQKLKYKSLLNLKQFHFNNKKSLQKLCKYNRVNFLFLSEFVNKIKKPIVKKIRNNKFIKRFNEFYSCTFQPKIKNIFRMIKNNAFKKLIIYHKFAKIIAKIYNRFRYYEKKKYRMLVKNIKIFKNLKNINNFNSFIIKLLKKNKEKNDITHKKNKIILFLFKFNFRKFVDSCLITKQNKKNNKIILEKIFRKLIKFRFFQFVSSLYLKKKKCLDKATNKMTNAIISPKNFFRNVKQSFRKFSMNLNFKQNMKGLLEICRYNIKLKKEFMKVSSFMFKEAKTFFKLVTLNLIKRKNKIYNSNSVLAFFLNKVKQNLNNKKVYKCSKKSSEDKLRNLSFFILKNYYFFKTQKSHRTKIFNEKIKSLQKKYYYENYFINISKLKAKSELLIKNNNKNKINWIFYSLKKLFIAKKIKERNNFLILKSYVQFFKNIQDKQNKLQKKHNKFIDFLKYKYTSNLKKLIIKHLKKNTNSKNIKEEIKNFKIRRTFLHFNSNIFNIVNFRNSKLKLLKIIFIKKCLVSVQKFHNSKKYLITLFFTKIKNKIKTNIKESFIVNNIKLHNIITVQRKYLSMLSVISKINHLSKLIVKLKFNNLKSKFYYFGNKIIFRDKCLKIINKIMYGLKKYTISILKNNNAENKEILYSIKKFKCKHSLKLLLKKLINSMYCSDMKQKGKLLILKNSNFLTKANNRKFSKLNLIKSKIKLFKNKLNTKKMMTFFQKIKKFIERGKIKKKLEYNKTNSLKVIFKKFATCKVKKIYKAKNFFFEILKMNILKKLKGYRVNYIKQAKNILLNKIRKKVMNKLSSYKSANIGKKNNIFKSHLIKIILIKLRLQKNNPLLKLKMKKLKVIYDLKKKALIIKQFLNKIFSLYKKRKCERLRSLSKKLKDKNNKIIFFKTINDKIFKDKNEFFKLQKFLIHKFFNIFKKENNLNFILPNLSNIYRRFILTKYLKIFTNASENLKLNKKIITFIQKTNFKMLKIKIYSRRKYYYLKNRLQYFTRSKIVFYNLKKYVKHKKIMTKKKINLEKNLKKKFIKLLLRKLCGWRNKTYIKKQQIFFILKNNALFSRDLKRYLKEAEC